MQECNPFGKPAHRVRIKYICSMTDNIWIIEAINPPDSINSYRLAKRRSINGLQGNSEACVPTTCVGKKQQSLSRPQSILHRQEAFLRNTWCIRRMHEASKRSAKYKSSFTFSFRHNMIQDDRIYYGRAYVGKVCTSYGVGVVRLSDFSHTVRLISHELGHSWVCE